MSKLITQKQIDYINKLHRYDRSIKITTQITSLEASKIIKHLLDCKAKSDTEFRKFRNETSESSYGYHSVMMWNEAQGGW